MNPGDPAGERAHLATIVVQPVRSVRGIAGELDYLLPYVRAIVGMCPSGDLVVHRGPSPTQMLLSDPPQTEHAWRLEACTEKLPFVLVCSPHRMGTYCRDRNWPETPRSAYTDDLQEELVAVARGAESVRCDVRPDDDGFVIHMVRRAVPIYLVDKCGKHYSATLDPTPAVSHLNSPLRAPVAQERITQKPDAASRATTRRLSSRPRRSPARRRRPVRSGVCPRWTARPWRSTSALRVARWLHAPRGNPCRRDG
jgi:hypothetical protein